MAFTQSNPRERIGAAILTLLVVGALGIALIVGLRVGKPVALLTNDLKLFAASLPPPPPPEKVVPRQTQSHRREGAAAPPNLRSKATELVVPPPLVPPVVPPPPIIAAPVAGLGGDPTAGASDRRGPGTGAGGVGNGTGSGGRGDGDGDGGDETGPRLRKGRIRNSDKPRKPELRSGMRTVGVDYAVETDGSARDCRITKSSGDRDLDETTCRLIEQRFKFYPARDAAGRAVTSYITERHEWNVNDGLPDDGEP